ncbi:MAG: aminomethyltransferase family protein [Betaproteobacteria bacterium]
MPRTAWAFVMLSAFFERRGIEQAELPSGGSVPVRFSSPVNEHLATRRGVGLFDFSFMGWWSFAGPEACECLQRLQTRDLRGLEPGKVCYTLLCRGDGSVLIDATVWCLRPDQYWLFTGRRSDVAHLQQCARDFDVELSVLSGTHAIIAVQGPASAGLLEQTLPASVNGLRYFAFRPGTLEGDTMWIGRLGFTGELGYELLVSSQQAAMLWSRLVEVPFAAERRECGMQAANSLRIEAGFIHFAYELERPVLPVELGLSRLLRVTPDGFIGQDALRRTPTAPRRLAGVSIGTTGRREPDRRLDHPGTLVHLTSEAFSPLFGRTLGLALVERTAEPGGVVHTEDGRSGELVRLPFRAPTSAQRR